MGSRVGSGSPPWTPSLRSLPACEQVLCNTLFQIYELTAHRLGTCPCARIHNDGMYNREVSAVVEEKICWQELQKAARVARSEASRCSSDRMGCLKMPSFLRASLFCSPCHGSCCSPCICFIICTQNQPRLQHVHRVPTGLERYGQVSSTISFDA